jgi:ATP-dependent exoDNAse (exonuclease V) alpha subunit
VENILEPKDDRIFLECEETLVSQEIINQVVLAKERGLDIIRDIQVLIPMYRGEIGINAINDHIQALVNPLKHGSKEEIKYNGQIFRVNDKVIQLVNRSEKKRDERRYRYHHEFYLQRPRNQRRECFVRFRLCRIYLGRNGRFETGLCHQCP